MTQYLPQKQVYSLAPHTASKNLLFLILSLDIDYTTYSWLQLS